MRQVVLDTETTGLDIANDHRIIEIAGVELVNRKLTKNSYHCLLYTSPSPRDKRQSRMPSSA